MRPLSFALTLALTCAGTAGAQTTGVPCMNDYTIFGPAGAGGISGATSCAALAFPGGGPAVLTISGSPTALLALVFVKGAPCAAGTLCLPPSFCPIPFTACAGTTNLSYDLTLPVPAPTFVCPMGPSPDGVCTSCTLTVLLPPMISFSTQTVILDLVCGSPLLHALPTQAYDVTT